MGPIDPFGGGGGMPPIGAPGSMGPMEQMQSQLPAPPMDDDPPPTPRTQEPYAPVAELRIGDSPAFKDAPKSLPASENYAEDPDVKLLCESDLLPIVNRIKENRSPLEEEWLATQRLRTMTHDGNQKYRGRSNVYMPTYATAHDTIVAQLSRGLFPSDDYMDVEAEDVAAEGMAELVKTKLRYAFECEAKLKINLKPAISQLVDHGNGVIKYWQDTGQQFQGHKRKGKGFGFTQTKPRGFTVSARSIFNVVVYPENASDEKEVLITAEYITMSRQYALSMAKSERWLNTNTALNSTSINNEDDQHARDRTLQDIAKNPGLGTPVDNSDPKKPLAQLITAIEIWASIPLPPSAYVDGEIVGEPVPARVLMVGGVPVSVTRNPYFHQQHPYEWARTNVTPGSFYGSWAGRKAKSLQYMVNDLANQTNDCGIYALNPVLVVDTNLMTGPVLPIAPGRIYRTRNIKEAMRYEHPPAELIQYGSQLLSLYIGALMDNSGAPPVLQGVGKSEETATGQSILQRNSLQPLQDKVEDLEAQWMRPLMEHAWSLKVQYSDDPVKLPDGTVLTVADLDAFDYDFKYLASSQIANQQARAQQAIQFLASALPTAELLAANGKQMDPTVVLKMLFRDLGLRQFEQFVFPMPMMPGMGGPLQQMAGGPQQQQGGPPAPGTAPMQGSENNAPIPGGQETEPQATDEFAVTRSIADELASVAGRSGG